MKIGPSSSTGIGMFNRLILLIFMTIWTIAFAPLAQAAEGEHETRAPLIPHLSGPGSEQTYYQAIWVLIIFVIMLAILYPTAWRNVLIGLKKREERIRKDIADAEAARAKADATLRQYNAQLAAAETRVREMLSKATTDGERLATQIRMQAQHAAEETKERNAREIGAAKDAAIREIYEKTVDLSTRIAEKILKRN